MLADLSATYTHALMQQHRNIAARDESEKYAVADVLELADRAAHLAFAGWPRFMLGDLAGRNGWRVRAPPWLPRLTTPERSNGSHTAWADRQPAG